MKTQDISIKPGYYTIDLSSHSRWPRVDQRLLYSNSERACVIAALQDTLRPQHYEIGTQKLAHHIDLLAFSILPMGVSLLVFALSVHHAKQLGAVIAAKLKEFQENTLTYNPPAWDISTKVRHLPGPHSALTMSYRIHAKHSDWEYDRYSSIGFHLHGRRGDWMRLWRIANLYDNNPETYFLSQAAAISYCRELNASLVTASAT